MKHFLLKFNYGVEIGARLAYLGHFKRTKDKTIAQIAQDEMDHQIMLNTILTCNGQRPSVFINFPFLVIGNFIRLACLVCPLFMLDFVARSMEAFAIVNYRYLATRYPDFEGTLRVMADKEQEHQEFFRRGK
jgi:rubrerythrin